MQWLPQSVSGAGTYIQLIPADILGLSAMQYRTVPVPTVQYRTVRTDSTVRTAMKFSDYLHL